MRTSLILVPLLAPMVAFAQKTSGKVGGVLQLLDCELKEGT